MISRSGIELIKSFESFSPIVYRCPGGKNTIGYGHVIQSVDKNYRISKEIGEKLLLEDISCAMNVIVRNIRIPLNQNQFDALVSFAFNVGSAAFQRSSLRHKINSLWDDDEIKREFSRWVYAKGKKMPGLVYRRKCEADLFCDSLLEKP